MVEIVLQPQNAKFPIEYIPAGMFMDSKLEHHWNVWGSILFISLGSVISHRLLHPKNALCPICVTLLGIVTEVNSLQFKNARSEIVVTFFGMITVAMRFKIEAFVLECCGLKESFAI